MGRDVGRGNARDLHVTLGPCLKASGEHKSKPTQHSVKELQGMGIAPDIIILRSDEKITDEGIFRKVASFCNVAPDCVIENRTLPILYEAPLMLEEANLSSIVCRELQLNTPAPDLAEWINMVERIRRQNKKVTIALVGKYVQLHDAYLSVVEALRHAGYALDAKVELKWIDSEQLLPETIDSLLSCTDGIILPGGFGARGIEGMILAAQYAREHHLPYFGICLGMQIAVIEFARHAAGLNQANSREFDPDTPHPVIDFMPGQSDEIDKGGTLRLGSYPCEVQPETLLHRCYAQEHIAERHRHRYEFNNAYRAALAREGMSFCGISPNGKLVEAIEIADEPFYVGVQFHPEFKSRPNKPHPLFLGFVRACLCTAEAKA